MDRFGIAIACAGEDSGPAAPPKHADRRAVLRSERRFAEGPRKLLQKDACGSAAIPIPLVEFEDHDNDSAFLDSQEDHLTGKGWMFYDRVLDDFFHGRIPPI